MSTNSLFLKIAANITIEEVADFLGVKIEQQEDRFSNSFEKILSVGHIRIPYQIGPREDKDEYYKPHSAGPWHLILELQLQRKSWSDFQLYLALRICGYFWWKAGGYYLAIYDTGEPAFIANEKGLLLPDMARRMHEGYPFPGEFEERHTFYRPDGGGMPLPE